MKYLDFEKHIKKELSGSKEAVQMDALLASLNLGDKRPKKKGFALWMLIPFLLLAISIFAWKGMNYNSSLSDSNQVLDRTNVLAAHNEQSPTENSNEESNQSTPISSNQEIETNSDEESNQYLNSSNIQTKETSLNKSISTSTKTINSANKPAQNSDNVSVFSENNIVDDKLLIPLKVPNVNSSSLYKQETGVNNVSTQTSNSKSESDNINFSASTLESKVSRELLSVANLDQSMATLYENNVDGNMFKRMRINCPSFDNSGWHMALIPEVGLFYPIKTLESTSLEEESAAFKERIKSETTLEGLEVGLYAMLVRDKIPLYLKAGASYSRISERMDLKYEYTVQDTTIGIVSSTVSDDGDTITHIYGDIVTETTFKGSNRQHHYIHLFDIPISLGYTTYIGGFDIGIEAGVKINFMTRATGNLLTSQNGYTNLSLNKLFKNRIGVNYFGGLMIGRNFGRFGDIYIAPRITYFPNDFSNQNNLISQKYLNIGLNAGVVYKIN